jgi:hypothetical protein
VKATGVKYTTARAAVQDIHQLAEQNDWTYAEAEAWYDDPANQVACEDCGWTNGMLCPECPGCGCYNGRCSGWRHSEFAHEDERFDQEPDECPECGADMSMGSYEECACS